MKMTQKTKLKNAYAAMGALIIVATLTTPASADNSQVTPYTMTFISDQGHGTKVALGKYDRAIEKLTASKRRPKNPFAHETNLCVAYTKSGEIQDASDACNRAIAHVKKKEARMSKKRLARSDEFRAYRADLAVALANRGVLLAVTGDTELARQDFLAAIDLRTRMSPIIEGNLVRLGHKNVPDA